MSVSLYTPTGQRLKARDTIELPWGTMRRVIEFAEIAGLHALGLHCSKCSQDIVAKNGDHDPVLTMTCGCREFWSTNPGVGRA
jgi:hypothetical protein